MAKTIDFNAFNQPTITVVLCDDEKTTLKVTAPTTELIERLQANKDTLVETYKSGDKEAVQEIYNFAAELMSCNEQGIKVTADELRGKYRMNFFMLFKFMTVYMEFVDEISNAKN